MTNARPHATPPLYWWYLGGVQTLFALFVLDGGPRFVPPQWPAGLSLAGLVAVVDVVAAPALLFAWLSRRRPAVAVFGACVVALVGLFSTCAWLGASELQAALSALPPLQVVAIASLLLAFTAYEARLLVLLAGAWRTPNHDVAIAQLTHAEPGESSLARHVKRWQAVELRFWAYGLFARPPARDAFAGTEHFGYARQSGNAATWTGWAVVNAIPAPILHALLHEQDAAAALLVTATTLLGSLWCFAEARAARHRPVSLDATTLHLRYGLLVDRTIPRLAIRSARTLDWKDLDARGITHHAGCGGANVRLELLSGEVIHVGLDDPAGFIAALAAARSNG